MAQSESTKQQHTKIRVVCVSDTHNRAPGEGYTLPKGDILIHAGDLTNQGSRAELEKAARWLDQADFAAKIVVAGNHDLSLDRNYRLQAKEGWRVTAEEVDCRTIIDDVPGVTYLEHSFAEVWVPGCERSLRVFGSPFSVESLTQNWAFQYAETDADRLWAAVPEDLDILITHTPPAGHVDTSEHWREGGCSSLKQVVRRVRPMLHVCGHCHEGRGAEIVRWPDETRSRESATAWTDPGSGNKKQSLLNLTRLESSPGSRSETAIANASIMARSWGRGVKAFNKPIVVDMILPDARRLT